MQRIRSLLFVITVCAACGADVALAPVPVKTTVYVLRAYNGRALDLVTCNPNLCFQTLGDTITLGSDSLANRAIIMRETNRMTAASQNYEQHYRGAYSTTGTTINLKTVSLDALNGTIAADSLRLRNTYGDSYIFVKAPTTP